MNGLGTLGQMDWIEAKIQGKVAEFLALKAKLVQLRASPSIAIKARAEGLWAVQLRMEKELTEVLKKIELVKTGAWQSSFEILEFGNRLVNHIKKVNQLRRDSGQVVVAQPLFDVQFDWRIWAIPVAILAAPFISRIMR